MAFHETQFPTTISRGARGGPQRKTQIVELSSGDEERNASWANSKRRYDVGFAIRTADALAEVVAFHENRNGMLHAFRFKDWSDYKSSVPSVLAVSSDQIIGTGDGVITSFQLVKAYVSDSFTWTRDITKPVEDTVTVALDYVEAMAGWSVDLTTGVVTFDVPPAAGVVVTAGFEFDVPVRFDTDMMDVVLDFERLGTIPSIPIVEVRR